MIVWVIFIKFLMAQVFDWIFIKIWKSISESVIHLTRQNEPCWCTMVVRDYYARFLILTYTAARGIYRDKIPIAARAKRRTLDRQHLAIRASRVMWVFIVRAHR